MAKQPQKKAAAPEAAASTPSPPAAPPAGAAQDATEATASSNGASETTAAGAGDIAPTGGGLAALGAASFAAAQEALSQALAEGGVARDGDGRIIGLDPSSLPDRTGLIIRDRDVVFYFDDLRAVLDLGDGEVLTLADFFDLPRDQQADVITFLVNAARQAVDLRPEPYQLRVQPDLGYREPASIEDLPDAEPGFVWVTAKSRDGKPYRRAGVAWDGDFNPHQVADDQLEKLFGDRHLIFRD